MIMKLTALEILKGTKKTFLSIKIDIYNWSHFKFSVYVPMCIYISIFLSSFLFLPNKISSFILKLERSKEIHPF